MSVTYRKLEEKDNASTAEMIRAVMREFKTDRPGTVYTDPTTDHLSEVFKIEGSAYWIAEQNGEIVGGCGIFPTDGLPEGCVELVKYYVSAAVRGTGVGKMLMQKSIESAQHYGYNEMYLESLPELSKAIGIYEKAGFKMLNGPLGNSGHFACTIWMLLVL
ncbi:GNAT family N-acetyltransferase [Pedobacter sp. AW1-32]|uniref:GNAT family N-acetyltransferase n=1 Tax=Pedobacter sp. AW1-32 TaxID=3383026 RepID=UPI003FEFADC8